MALKVKQSISKKKLLLTIGIVILSIGLIIGGFFTIKAIVNHNREYEEDIRCTIQGHVLDQYKDGVADVSFIYNNEVIYTTLAGGRFLIDNVKKGSKIHIRCSNDKIVLPYKEFDVKESIYITNSSNGFVIEVNNTNSNKQIATVMASDKNGSPLSGVYVYSNQVFIGKTDHKGLINITIQNGDCDIELKKENYYFKKMSLTNNDIGKTIQISGNYIADTITSERVVTFYFKDLDGLIYKNLDIYYLSYENHQYNIKKTLTTTGSYSIVDKYKYSHFTAYSTLSNKNGMYYFVDEVYFTNQDATFNLKEGYKIEIEIDSSINSEQIYLESTDNSTDKIYLVKNNKIIIYSDDLNYNFYTIFNHVYGGKLNLYDEEGNIVTQINEGYSKLILK